jgi:DNA repair protein RadC
MLDTQNRISKLEQISEGTIAEAPIYTRNIIQTILNSNAAKVIFAHNHPGGSLRASTCDIEATQKLVETCKLCQFTL